MKDYKNFIENKKIKAQLEGIDSEKININDMLFDFQKDIVKWALKKGRGAIFADCGLGKTPMQLEWAKHIHEHTNKPILILAPLAVSKQTQREGQKFGIEVNVCRRQGDIINGINITNYEMIDHFEHEVFGGIVLDESSILKSFTGKVRTQIIESFGNTPYRLACTATPAPNDFMELGNHAEFLGVMTRTEMLATFFIHDGGDTAKWRLKGHAQDKFWEWVASWAVVIKSPSDLGYDDGSFKLPELKIHEHILQSEPTQEMFIAMPAQTLTERRQARKESIDDRVNKAAEIIEKLDGQCLVWCDFNAESEMLKNAIDGAVEVKGADKPEHKENSMMGFAAEELKILVSKPSICGFGMNFQSCNTMIFCGLSDSYEQFYQAVRRCWRFGQKKQVDVHVIISEKEEAVLQNIKRKGVDAEIMVKKMVKHTQQITQKEIHSTQRDELSYKEDMAVSPKWTLHLGDCVEKIRTIKDDSIHYSIFSPPFASLYTYSNSERDMGNSKTTDEFYNHFKFLVKELHRVLMPGRLLSFHCMNLPTSKERDGFIGIRDFRGELIRMFEEEGFIYHSEVCIWKDPVIAMQRTKALGLLHKQLKKDSCMSRQGIADYLVTMRKKGENPERVTHTNESFPVSVWQKYASPIWTDIKPSDTLQKESARENNDERHICPLQLTVIQRALELWTNEGDTVLSPFAGIGSEIYQAVKMGRKGIGIELKESYWKCAINNLKALELEKNQLSIFEGVI